MIGKKRYEQTNALLNRELENKKVLIAVHRGSSGGNIIENTIPAYETSLKMGGDVIESDVVKSQDGKLFNFHNGMERKNFQQDIDLRTLTSEQITKLKYINDNLEEIDYPIEKLYDTLMYFKGKGLINLDRAWEFFPDIFNVIDQTGTMGQVILKGPLIENTITALKNSPNKYMFMPKIGTLQELSTVLNMKEVNIVGVEIKVETIDNDFFQKNNIDKIKENNLFVWINALTMDDNKKLFAGFDDNTSLIKGADSGWQVILEKGADIIQTDWPALLSEHRNRWIREKTIS